MLDAVLVVVVNVWSVLGTALRAFVKSKFVAHGLMYPPDTLRTVSQS
jgi:hypothetical protein